MFCLGWNIAASWRSCRQFEDQAVTTVLYQWLRLPGCQVDRLSGCQVARLPGRQVAKPGSDNNSLPVAQAQVVVVHTQGHILLKVFEALRDEVLDPQRQLQLVNLLLVGELGEHGGAATILQ